MQKFKSENRLQSFLLPPSVEDFIKEDHLARVVDEVVNNLDVSIIEAKYSHLGQRSYSPKMLLKLLFYGYTIGVRSGRKIASACENDVAFMYLSCMYKPDFRTLNDFRKNNVDEVEDFFVQIVKLCASLQMISVGTLVIDSTKLRANASSRLMKSREQYVQMEADITHQIKGMLEEAEAIDSAEDKKWGDKRGDELPEGIATKEKLRDKVKQALEQLKDGEKRNYTDCDAKVIKGSGRLQTNYNCQASCTAEGIIVSAYATNIASDKEQLIEVITQAEKNIGINVTTILADSGYASYENYEQLNKLSKHILIPDQEKEAEAIKAASNPYHRSHFKYDAANDHFICPEDKLLPYYSSYTHKRNKQKGKWYQGIECCSCVQRSECTKGNMRQIHVEDRMPLRQKIRDILDSPAGKQLYKQRQQIIEPIFGNLKHNLKYTMMHLRTLKKVNAEWLLICLTHNIRKIWIIKGQVA